MILELTDVVKLYGKTPNQVRAVDHVSLQVKKGEIVLIMGPSGSGKTTLLTMAGSLLRPSSGSVRINGIETTKLNHTELSSVRLKQIGFVFQSFNLLSALTALENVAVPLIASGKARHRAMESAASALDKLGLGNRGHHLPKDLSGGEKQRVSIARALANNPGLLLADEPTANLDSKTGKEVMSILCATASHEQKAVVIVSHDQRIMDIASRVLWFEDGRITHETTGGLQLSNQGGYKNTMMPELFLAS